MIQKPDLKSVCLDGTGNPKSLASVSLAKRSYVKVPDKKRLKLIQLLQETQLTIKAAAAQLGVHYSTAKCIVKVFRQERHVVALAKRAKAPASSHHASPPTVKLFSNELSTLVKTPPLVSAAPQSAKQGREGEVRFDFGVYGNWISARYGAFKC